jgi:hypothetical protein
MALTQRDANRLIDNIVGEIKSYMKPEDVFDDDELEKWALENGFVKEES